jgi:hypothetical protein
VAGHSEYQRKALISPPGQELLAWPAEGAKRRELVLKQLSKAKTPLTEVELAGHFVGCSADDVAEVTKVLSTDKEIEAVVVPGQPRMWRAVGHAQRELARTNTRYRLVAPTRGR